MNHKGGLVGLGPLGYIYTTQQSGTIPLYRCSLPNGLDHFVSGDSNCEGMIKEGLLGYALAP